MAFKDFSTNNFQLTAFGNAQISTSVKKYGDGSALFDGNGDYVRGNVNINYDNNFTIECWLYRTGSGSVLTFFEAGDIQPGQGGLHLYIDGSGQVVWNNGLAGDIEAGTAPLNQWIHVAAVRYNGTNTLYVNGVSVGSGTQTFPVTNNIITIGGAPEYGFYFPGYIDDFRITSGIARYTANFTPPQQQLPEPSDPYADNVSLLLHMDGSNGSQTFTDSSSNNFTLSAFGGAQISTSVKKFGNGAAYFDGNVSNYVSLNSNSNFAFNEDFTIEGWFYFNQNNVGYQPLIAAYSNGDYTGWILTIETINTLHFYGSPGSSWDFILTSNYTPPTNQWIHIAVNRSQGSSKLFVNGVQQGLTNNNTSIVAGNTVAVGHYPYFPDFPRSFNGYIDDLRITKGVARYTTNFVPQTAPFVNPTPDPWSNILNSTYANDIVAAYDFRDYNGSNSVISKIGPNLETSNVTQVADGLEFVKGNTSWAFANSTVACSYPFTMVFVAKTTNTSTNESVLINCSPSRFGDTMLVFTRGSSSQGLMPYNGIDNQDTNYLPNGTEWYFYAVSFLNNGTVRYATRKASGNLNGTVNGNNGSIFNGYPGVAAGFGSQSQYGTSGKFRLALFINQAFSTEAQMDYLFNTILSGPASDLALQ